MKRVAIVTDSMACIPADLVAKHGILLAPSSVIIDNHVYQDGIDLTPGQVYDLQRRNRILPTTSAPSPGEHLEIYRQASETAESILHISIAPSLTMAYDSALQARELAREQLPRTRIEILDTGTAAGAQCFLVLAAARVIETGGDISAAMDTVHRMIPRVHLYVTVDTLYFLAKSGRVPKVAAWASSILSIKPILQIYGGEATAVERVRTRPRAISRLIEIMESRVHQKPVHVNLMHAGVPEEAEDLKEKLLRQFDCVEMYVTEFSPVMGAHTGPGLLGPAFYCDE